MAGMKRGAPHVRGVRSARGAAGGDFSARKRSTWEVIRRVGVYLRPYKFLAFANIGCAILSLAFAFAFPKLTQVMIDDVITPGRADLVWPAALALLGAFPAFTTLARQNSPLPLVASQNPGCSAAARVEPKGRAGI